MSDERRVVPAPAPPDAVAVSTAATTVAGVAEAKASHSGMPERSSSPPAGTETTARRRPRPALRIPDDEVSRPQQAARDAARAEVVRIESAPTIPVAAEAPAVLRPMRIISINPPSVPELVAARPAEASDPSEPSAPSEMKQTSQALTASAVHAGGFDADSPDEELPVPLIPASARGPRASPVPARRGAMTSPRPAPMVPPPEPVPAPSPYGSSVPAPAAAPPAPSPSPVPAPPMSVPPAPASPAPSASRPAPAARVSQPSPAARVTSQPAPAAPASSTRLHPSPAPAAPVGSQASPLPPRPTSRASPRPVPPSSPPPSPSAPPAPAAADHPSIRDQAAQVYGGVAEISPDDLVAVDFTPPPPRLEAIPPPARPVQVVQPPPISKKAAPVTIAAPAPAVAPAPALRPSKPPLVIVPPHMGSVAPQQPAEGPGSRRKGRLWWEELFNDDYLRASERISAEQLEREVNFIEDSLGVERGGAVLDLGCGTGRHAVELARRGYQVVGFDLSLAMLAHASDEAHEHKAKLNFVQGDMREMTFAEQFDGVYCWNTSFGYFDEEKNALIVDRIHDALKGGGLLLLDVVNRDFLVQQSPSLAWFEGDGCVCMDEMIVDFITSRMRVKRTMMLDDGRTREMEYAMRVYSLHELGKMLHEHGFKVCEVSGRIATPGVFFGHESPRTIILAEKR